MRPAPVRALCAVLVAGLVAACSSGGEKVAPANDPDALVVEVASFDIAAGPPSRFIAGVLSVDQRLVGFGTVAMQFSFLGQGRAQGEPTPGPATTGTFLVVPGSDVPTPAPTDPVVVQGVSRGVYATQVGFDRPGFWQVEVTARIDGKSRRGTGAFAVADRHRIAAPGDAALPVENLTMASTDVPKAAIDSRAGTDGEVPDPGLHGTTVAAAIGAQRPAVVVFATPVYCTSRFCGPVTDLVGELARDHGAKADFIHVEIWRDFQASTINKSAADWLLRDDDLNEPWVFVIGADGRIVARFDNVVTRAELEPLIQAL
ncbi:MAG: hypothetical protein ACR2HV_00795 [Acidimicrobiales bacterium]